MTIFKYTLISLSLMTTSIYANERDLSYLEVHQQVRADSYSVEIDSVINDHYYSHLEFTDEMIQYYKRIESIKRENPYLSAEDLVNLVDNTLQINELETQSFSNIQGLSDIYDKWAKLTTPEKILVVQNPAKALITDVVRKKAFETTREVMGGGPALGNKKDAFRHGIWNAFMCKYISENWAYQIATAHEYKTADELQQKASDGNYEYLHQDMDLHNNKEGRASWHWYDTISFTSDEELVNRINSKITSGTKESGQLYWLN